MFKVMNHPIYLQNKLVQYICTAEKDKQKSFSNVFRLRRISYSIEMRFVWNYINIYSTFSKPKRKRIEYDVILEFF